MKIIYSIYNMPNKGLAKIEFFYILNKKDIVLLNQFENKVFTCEIAVRFKNFKTTTLTSERVESKGEQFIKIEWGNPKKYERKIDRNGRDYWQYINVEEIVLKSITPDQPVFASIILQMEKHVKQVMNECKSKVLHDKESCFEKVLNIDEGGVHISTI